MQISMFKRPFNYFVSARLNHPVSLQLQLPLIIVHTYLSLSGDAFFILDTSSVYRASCRTDHATMHDTFE
jgi:hypothetical protein